MKGQIIVPDHTGHTTIEWDTKVPETVAHAQDEFDRIVQSNYLMTTTTEKPGKATQVRKFDPEVTEYIAVAPLAGG